MFLHPMTAISRADSVSNMRGSMTRMCVIGEADPFVARCSKRFAAESGLQTVVARVGEAAVRLREPGMLDADFS